MYGYIAFYNRNKIELYANSLWEAREKAIKEFKVPKSKQGLLAVELAEIDGQEVVHVAVD